MTRIVRPESEVSMLKPEYIVPLMPVLCSEKATESTGNTYKAGSGCSTGTRWQRIRGVFSPHQACVPSPAAVLKRVEQICNFDIEEAVDWENPADETKHFMAHIGKAAVLSKQAKL